LFDALKSIAHLQGRWDVAYTTTQRPDRVEASISPAAAPGRSVDGAASGGARGGGSVDPGDLARRQRDIGRTAVPVDADVEALQPGVASTADRRRPVCGWVNGFRTCSAPGCVRQPSLR